MGIDVEALEPEGEEPAGGARRSRALNQGVARLFEEIAAILEIQGEQPFRTNAYRVAARNVAGAPESLDSLFAQGRLREIPGIGRALEAKIVEYLSTGQMELHERLKREFPIGLLSLLEVPGLGPSKARALYQDLHLASVADLERVAREGKLLGVPGFGQKAVDDLLRGIERMKERTTRDLISTGWAMADEVQMALRAGGAQRVAVVGSVRRMRESIGNLDLVATAAGAGADPLEALTTLPEVVEVVGRSPDEARVLLYGGLQVRLHLVPSAAWGSALVWHTGSRAHVDRLVALARRRGWRLSPGGLEDEASGERLAGADEAAVYERLGLEWVPPELREDSGEVEAAQAGALPRLVELSDLKGDLHCHTDWTDGVHSLEEMARAAKAKGHQYLALTDHSQSLTIARGLTPERLAEERRLVDRVNHKLAPFVVLLGTEMDILRDGRLDFPDEVLATLDYVSASVHSGFRQSREVMTERIIRAVSNPRVHTLNHPHGRLIRRREGYAVDMQAVVEAAARAGCALELNAQPDRLDLDGSWARRARAAGARFTISSDAHSVGNLELLRFGVGSARRGWLTAADVLNTRPVGELRALLARGAARPASRSE